ncbi:hypothetical protein ACFLU5_10095 [Bacteroidota bacterium]
MKKILIGIVLVVILSIIMIGYYLYNKPHVDVSSRHADYSFTADELYWEFVEDDVIALNKYSDKIIELTGRLQLISKSDKSISNIVMGGEIAVVNCEMDSLYVLQLESSQEGDQIQIRGIFVGFDDLLGELQLKKCIMVK